MIKVDSEDFVSIIQIRGKVTSGCAGVYGGDVELKLSCVIDGYLHTRYLHANDYMGRYYTLADVSMYDYLVGDVASIDEIEFLEEYEEFEETKKSKYCKYFELANKNLDALMKN